MSLPALQTSASPPAPTSANSSHDAAAKSGGGAAFAAIISALLGETAPAKAPNGAAKDASTASQGDARGEKAPKSSDSGAIDSDLAGLVLGALPTAAQFAQQVAGTAGRAGRDSASTQTVSTRAPLWRAQTALATTASATAASATTVAGSTPLASTATALNALTTSSFANAGALETPEEVQPLASAAPAVTFSVVQNRTHLGVDSAAQTVAKDPILRAQSPANVAAQATTVQTAPATVVATAAPPSQAKAPSESRPGANRSAAATTASSAPTSSSVAASSVEPVSSASSAQNETWPQKSPNRDGSQTAAPAAPAVNVTTNGAAALTAPTTAATNGAVVSLGPITVAQLADTLATQASGLGSQATSAASAAAGTASVSAAQPMKELEIQLDPADLGAVSVKMRLSDGKLSVVMEVSKPSTLKAVEGDRAVIADRLGSSVQSLESLVIKPAAASQTTAESGSGGAGERSEGRSNAQSDAAGGGDSPSEQQSSRRDDSAGDRSRQTPSREPVAGRGFGDMVV